MYVYTLTPVDLAVISQKPFAQYQVMSHTSERCPGTYQTRLANTNIPEVRCGRRRVQHAKMQKKTYSLTLLSQTVLGRCELMCRSEAEEAPGVTRTSSAQKANEKWASSRVQKHYPDAGIKEDGGGGAHPGGGLSKEQDVTVASFFIDIHRFLSQGSIKMSPLGPRITKR